MFSGGGFQPGTTVRVLDGSRQLAEAPVASDTTFSQEVCFGADDSVGEHRLSSVGVEAASTTIRAADVRAFAAARGTAADAAATAPQVAPGISRTPSRTLAAKVVVLGVAESAPRADAPALNTPAARSTSGRLVAALGGATLLALLGVVIAYLPRGRGRRRLT